MAKLKVYNPPPNWPAPPTGWTPPPDWQPDPEWGPAPEGWTFFEEQRANPQAWLYGFGAALVPFLVLIVIGSVLARSAPSPYVFGLFFGRFVAAGLITGAIGYFSSARWRPWLYVLIAVGSYVAVGVLSSLGKQTGA